MSMLSITCSVCYTCVRAPEGSSRIMMGRGGAGIRHLGQFWDSMGLE